MTSTPPPNRPAHPWGAIGTGAATLGFCAACCAGPVLALLGGIGAGVAVAAVWMPALAVVTVAAGLGVFAVRRRRRRATCRPGQAGVVDLGMPTLAPPGPAPAAAPSEQ